MQNSDLEDGVLDWLQRKKRVEETYPSTPVPVILPLEKGSEFEKIRSHLDYFGDNVAYLASRRSKGGFITINSEADVQDLLYVMLKSSFPGLIFEDPAGKVAASYSIRDLYFPNSKTVLEAKYITTPKEVKSLEKQLHDDIMKYSDSAECQAIIFFIFDPNYSIADRRTFIQKMNQEEGQFMRSGKSVIVTTVIRPM